MKFHILAIFLVISILLFGTIAISSPAALQKYAEKPQPEYVKGELLVLVKDNVQAKTMASLLSSYSKRVSSVEPVYKGNYPVPENSDIFNLYTIYFPENTDIERMAKLYNKAWFVDIAEPLRHHIFPPREVF